MQNELDRAPGHLHAIIRQNQRLRVREVCKGRVNVLPPQRRIAGQYLVDRRTLAEAIQNHCYWNPRACRAKVATADLRVPGQILLPVSHTSLYEHPMNDPTDIPTYLKLFGPDLGQRVLDHFPPLHRPTDPTWPALDQLKRRPFPAQTLAIMGIVKRWDQARCAAAVAECGTGKTLISLGSIFTHARGRRFTALAMVPPMLLDKWAREVLSTLPGVRVFFIDGLRNGVPANGHTGINEVKLRAGRIVREGLRATLTDLRLAKHHRSARARWDCAINDNLAASKA